MEMIEIILPDGRVICFTGNDIGRLEAQQFVSGFCRALECFGIWDDGERYIGALNTNIKKIRNDMESQLPKP